MGVETAIAVAAIGALASAGTSYVQGQEQNRRAKTQARRQQEEITRQRKEAEAKRKEQIDQQRDQLGVNSMSTRATSETGVEGNTLG